MPAVVLSALAPVLWAGAAAGVVVVAGAVIFLNRHPTEVVWGSNDLHASWCLDGYSGADLDDGADCISSDAEAPSREDGDRITDLKRSIWVGLLRQYTRYRDVHCLDPVQVCLE